MQKREELCIAVLMLFYVSGLCPFTTANGFLEGSCSENKTFVCTFNTDVCKYQIQRLKKLSSSVLHGLRTKFKDIKEVIRGRKSKDRQYNCQNKMDKQHYTEN